MVIPLYIWLFFLQLVATGDESMQMEATMTDQVNSKTTALKEAEKRFMQLEMVMRRVAGKKQQAHTISATEDFLITTEVA